LASSVTESENRKVHIWRVESHIVGLLEKLRIRGSESRRVRKMSWSVVKFSSMRVRHLERRRVTVSVGVYANWREK